MEPGALLLGAVVCAVIGIFIGQSRGRWAIEGALWGFFLGPIGWLIMALGGYHGAKCPHCREAVDADAAVCPHCRLPIYRCPRCHRQIGRGQPTHCYECGTELRWR